MSTDDESLRESNMPVSLVIGGQWGDEGKAKIIDSLARGADFIVRFQGGANAGHTVVVGEERFAFHLVPSGILYPHVKCILGGGMVIDPLALVMEINALAFRGIEIEGRIFISEQAHMVLPHHILLDKGQEERKGKRRIGSTGRGITPAYMDKVGREGSRMCDFLLPRKAFVDYMRKKLKEKNKILRSAKLATVSSSGTMAKLLEAREYLAPMIIDTRQVLWRALAEKSRVLCEGAQGTLLDIDHGTYPFVTSSNATASGASTGAGIPPTVFGTILGVFKAYCTRVGNGPFPTEDKGRVGDKLRKLGAEYGTTTGRPRRCGWFDAVAARTVIKLNGITEIALTKLDVLDSFAKIKVCTEYRSGQKKYEVFPVDIRVLEKCQPRYVELDGWKMKTEAGPFENLPAKAKEFVNFLQKLLECKIKLISLGPERGAIIRVRQTDLCKLSRKN